ncbi:prefoldin subunit 3 isoform 1-T1 [Hipposideros larvatus]
MADAKDACGSGEVTSGNGRRYHLGIPEAVFVEDVDSFMKQPGNETADIVLKKLDEQYQKYKFMELNLAQKKRRLKGQIPEIKQTLEILKYMQKKKESTSSLETRFLLADNLYCKASVPPTDKVCLWLGANVMLEYDIDEAQALLEKNLSTATKNLDSLEEDLDFLRDQFTTTEVSILSFKRNQRRKGERCFSHSYLHCFNEKSPYFQAIGLFLPWPSPSTPQVPACSTWQALRPGAEPGM